MNEVEIYNNLNNSLIATGLFFIGWSFLVWVAGRAVTIAIENNAGIITKLVTTLFGLTAVWQFNNVLNFVPWNFAGAGHSLAVLKNSGTDLSARSEAFVNMTGSSAAEVPQFSLIPSDPIVLVFILSALYLVVGRLWVGNK